MKKLTVLYDGSCGFCLRCRWWMAKQPSFLELEFLATGSPEALARFPGLGHTREELTVVSDDGKVYRSERAWIMCLYALAEYRELSQRLAQPALMPFARAAFHLLTSSRRAISRWLGLASQEEILDVLGRAEAPTCEEEVKVTEAGRRPGVCRVCSQPMRDPSTYCDKCGSPHHQECWTYLGHCATFGCGSASRRKVRV
jgi:predicted DCC family thiol-disulfide oxidoreductase YuxK